MNFLAAVDEIGDRINRLSPSWEEFPEIAANELRKTTLLNLFQPDDLSVLRERHKRCEDEIGRSFNFSDECFYLYVGKNYTIELYHWLYSDTAIHDHDFQGAFQCLRGLNHQKCFRYKAKAELFPGLETGVLELSSSVEIAPGMIERIYDEDRFIHVVSHLDSTFNLCVRTAKKGDRPLRGYHLDGIRFTVPDQISGSAPIESLSSEDLLFIAHHGKVGDHARKLRANELLKERHGIDFIESQKKTWNYLQILSVEAKGF